jgi:flavin-binding protein dodecin
MALVKVIEVLAQSPQSWEDAARVAVAEASATVRNIRSIYIKDFEAKVADDAIVLYRVNAKISFVVEGTEEDEEASSAPP